MSFWRPQLQLELAYRGALDVVLHLEAVTLVDTQFARPATWRYEPGGGQQQDLENGAHHRQVLVSRADRNRCREQQRLCEPSP